jgi:cation diffusion facilitator family transporter
MILIEAVPDFFIPRQLENIGTGTILVIGASLINMAIGMYLLRCGKKLKSEALTADGRHLLTDFYTSAGVILGLALVRATGLAWLDPLAACLVAANIVLPGMRLVKKASSNLMDEADPEFLQRVVTALNHIKEPGWHYPHKLRAIRSGRYYHVDLHVIFPRFWSLEQVHAAQEELSRSLFANLGEEGDVMIHADPCEDIYCRSCGHATCSERVHDGAAKSWTVEEVVRARVEKKDQVEPQNIEQGISNIE